MQVLLCFEDNFSNSVEFFLLDGELAALALEANGLSGNPDENPKIQAINDALEGREDLIVRDIIKEPVIFARVGVEF